MRVPVKKSDAEHQRLAFQNVAQYLLKSTVIDQSNKMRVLIIFKVNQIPKCQSTRAEVVVALARVPEVPKLSDASRHGVTPSELPQPLIVYF